MTTVTQTHIANNYYTGQIHTFGGGLDDPTKHQMNLGFSNITVISAGHHVRTGGGYDIINFQDLSEVRSTVVGRIEDFDYSRDVIQIEGQTLDLFNLPGNTRIVEWNGDHNDAGAYAQQWLLIDTGLGHLMYSLDGARIDMNGDGGSNSNTHEKHFIDNIPDNFSALDNVAFIDQKNVVPAGYSPLGGYVINDGDVDSGDVLEIIYGSAQGDLIAGGLNDDVVDAGDGDDYIWGGSGHDNLTGAGGNDTIEGGSGNDVIDSGSGADTVYGGNGADQIITGDGDDFIFGGYDEADRRDEIFSGNGNDYIDAGYGNDLVNGGVGDDNIIGGPGVDRLIGQGGNDTLTGNSFSDEIFGGDGDDFINGGFGFDRINGGNGADQFYHFGVSGHGSDWIQDYDSAEGDVLLFGSSKALVDDFQVNYAQTANAGLSGVEEAFVIYKPTGQILWALIDGGAQDEINLQIGNIIYDIA